MREVDSTLNTVDRAETPGLENKATNAIVDMAHPETRGAFQQNADQTRAAVVDGGQLRFDTTDIYSSAASTPAMLSDASSAPAAIASPTDTASASDAGLSSSDASGNTAVIEQSDPVGVLSGGLSSSDVSGDTADIEQSDVVGAPAAAGQSDAPAPAAVAPLTPEQSLSAQSTVKLDTDMINVAADGTLSEFVSEGTGNLVTGLNGQQYIFTSGHVVGATGTDTPGETNYAEGPTKVTYADGMTTTAEVVANNSAETNDNYIGLSNHQDGTILSAIPSGPTSLHPSMSLDPNATLQPGDSVDTVGFGDYGNGQLTGISQQYKGDYLVDNGSNGVQPMQLFTGNGVHGMSGAAIVDSDHNVIGIYTQGTDGDHSDPSGTNMDTPISAITNLLDAQNVWSPNYIGSLMNAKPQPIATTNEGGNSVDSNKLQWVTLSDGTVLNQTAAGLKAEGVETPTTAPVPDAPATVPAVDAPVVPTVDAPANTTDAVPAATAPAEAPVITSPDMIGGSYGIDSSALNAADMAQAEAAVNQLSGMDYGIGMDYGMDSMMD